MLEKPHAKETTKMKDASQPDGYGGCQHLCHFLHSPPRWYQPSQQNAWCRLAGTIRWLPQTRLGCARVQLLSCGGSVDARMKATCIHSQHPHQLRSRPTHGHCVGQTDLHTNGACQSICTRRTVHMCAPNLFLFLLPCSLHGIGQNNRVIVRFNPTVNFTPLSTTSGNLPGSRTTARAGELNTSCSTKRKRTNLSCS